MIRGFCAGALSAAKNGNLLEFIGGLAEGNHFLNLFTKMISDPVYGLPIAISLSIFLLSVIFLIFSSSPEPPKPPRINEVIKLDQEKVVDTVPCGEIENLVEYKDGKIVMCRLIDYSCSFTIDSFSKSFFVGAGSRLSSLTVTARTTLMYVLFSFLAYFLQLISDLLHNCRTKQLVTMLVR